MPPVIERESVPGCGWVRILGVGVVWMGEQYGPILAQRVVGRHGVKNRRVIKVGLSQFAVTTWRNP